MQMAKVHFPPNMKCTYCGKQIPAIATFCPQCGNDLRTAPMPSPTVTLPTFQGQQAKLFRASRWSWIVAVLLLTVFVGTAAYRNVEEARTASDNRKTMESLRKSMPAFAPTVFGAEEKKGPITESERMERQLTIDAYEKAKRDCEQLQRMATEPGSMVSRESVEMAKSTLEMLELSKRQADIEWQRRLENVR